MKKRRYLTAGEWTLWQHFTNDAAPLDPSRRSLPPDTEALVPPKTGANGPAADIGKEAGFPLPKRSREESPRRTLPYLSAGQLAAMDRRQGLRLKRGQHPIDASLDLHGMTQEVAHIAFLRFVEEAVRRGHRCLLVITGKGSGRTAEGKREYGVLRQALPGWINAPALRPHILAYHHARIRDGGTGAYYLFLRRNRTA